MALTLHHLDSITREYMELEIQADIASEQIYYSKHLTALGRQKWGGLLLKAAQERDSVWLGGLLRDGRLAVARIQGFDKNGKRYTNVFTPEHLADSEFNRYYIRAMCCRAIDEGIPYLITYRAKPVRNPISRVGVRIDPEKLLRDLRINKGKTHHDIPSNPNSGISVRWPD